jgi:hypothetical protein
MERRSLDATPFNAIRHFALPPQRFRGHVPTRCCVPSRLSLARVCSLFVTLFELDVWIRRGWSVGRYRRRNRRSLVEPDLQQISSSYSS